MRLPQFLKTTPKQLHRLVNCDLLSCFLGRFEALSLFFVNDQLKIICTCLIRKFLLWTLL